jgi:uncharacterized protein DUF2489
VNIEDDPQLDRFLQAEQKKQADNKEYFIRGNIVAICQALLVEEMGVIGASRRLSNLGWALSDNRDQDFVVFDGISSETEHLPIGDERHNWSVEALGEKDMEIQRAEALYKEDAKTACQNLIARFSLTANCNR